MSKTLRKMLFASLAALMIASTGASLNNTNVNAKRRHARTHRVYRHRRVRKHAKKHIRRSHSRSTWKHYAPKAIKGYWLTKHHHETWGLTFQNNGVAFNPSGAAIENWNHPQYKYDGYNSYSIKPSANSHNTANYLGKHSHQRYYIKKHGKRISVWINGNQYIGTYHHVSRKTFLS